VISRALAQGGGPPQPPANRRGATHQRAALGQLLEVGASRCVEIPGSGSGSFAGSATTGFRRGRVGAGDIELGGGGGAGGGQRRLLLRPLFSPFRNRGGVDTGGDRGLAHPGDIEQLDQPLGRGGRDVAVLRQPPQQADPLLETMDLRHSFLVRLAQGFSDSPGCMFALGGVGDLLGPRQLRRGVARRRIVARVSDRGGVLASGDHLGFQPLQPQPSLGEPGLRLRNAESGGGESLS